MSNVGPTAIQLGISDHNPIVKDGIICWNLWAPGTRNGIQSETIERNAMQAVKNNIYPHNVADVVKQRLLKEVQYLADLIIASGKDNIDAICLQEAAYNESEIQVRDYFLAILNLELAAKGLNEFTFSFDSSAMPISENNIGLMSKTTGDAFGQLILVNKNKYKPVSSQSLNFVGQQGRIFEIQLEPKNPGLAPRRIWNGHLKWYGNAGNAHHQHLQEIVKEAARQGATLAADANAPVMSLCQSMDFIARDASIFANPSDPNTANKVMGKTQGEYVDAIITPKSAPHLKPVTNIGKPIPAPYIPPSQPTIPVTPRSKQSKPLATKVPKASVPQAPKSTPQVPKPSAPEVPASSATQSTESSTGQFIVPMTLVCGLLAACVAYYFSFAILPIALSVSVFVLLGLKLRQHLFESKLAELTISSKQELPVFQAGKRAANSWGDYAKSFYDRSAWWHYRTFGAGMYERVTNTDSANAPSKKLTSANQP